MSADRPTAPRPRDEIDAFESKMDSRARSSAQTNSKPVTDSALVSTSQKEARSVPGVWLVHRCCNPIHGRKFALVSDAAHENAVRCHATPFAPGMRAGALCQWGGVRSRFKRTGGVRDR